MSGLSIEYPRDWESLIDESMLHDLTSEAFEFHLVKRPQIKTRSLLGEGIVASSMAPRELLQIFWQSEKTQETVDPEALLGLADQIIQKVESGEKD